MKKAVLWLDFFILAAIVASDVFLIISPDLAFKASASVLFVAGATVNAAYAVKNKANKSFAALMLIGCVFAMAGDIVNYFPGDIYFTVGATLFAVAHMLYIAAYYRLCGFRFVDIVAASIIFVPSLMFILFAPVFDFGGAAMEAVCIAYALILSIMAGKAFSTASTRTATGAVIAVASALFYISDFALLINMFGDEHAVSRVICLATYYPAQFLLAFSVFTHADRGVNIFKAAFCRIFQFVLKVALPFLPYRDPKIIDRISDIPRTLEENGKSRPLVVTDKTVRSLGLIDGLKKSLVAADMKYSVYDGVVANPTTDNVRAALSVYKKGDCDCLVAVGGGSPMDCAKGVGALVARPKKTLGKLRGILKVRKKIPLLVAVPTTAGTGSETTLAAVIVDSETRHKYAINDFPLIPSYAVLDESITATLPKHVVATTGMDALTHAIEAYIGRGGNGGTRADALDAIKLVFENIEEAYASGSDAARKNMLVAAHKAGRAFSKAYVGYVHALAHALGGKYDTPHGKANAVILPVVLEEYGKSVHKKLWKIAVHCDLVDKSASRADGAQALIAKIKELNAKTGIPESLPEIKAGDIRDLARYAEREANPLYPVPVLWDENKLAEVYNKLMSNEPEQSEIKDIVAAQKAFFKSGKTLDVKYRKEKLERLYAQITESLPLIHAALMNDLGKSDMESYACETGLALSELSYMIKHIKKFAKPRRAHTPIAHCISKSYTLSSPYGTALVMSPWNYPFLLSVDPLVDAVAAGNTVVIKTSVNSPETGKAIKSVVEKVFSPEYVAVVPGGGNTNVELKAEKFDYVFFTGSKRVGIEIYENAAKTLTPVTLELGGKSPCIVDATANIPLAAKRIVWGKFLNLGQTCVAPDYVFCHEKVHAAFVEQVKKQIAAQFGNALENPHYGKIVSKRHFDRLLGLIDGDKTVFGGKYDEQKLKIEPTVLDGVQKSDPVMQEEIFGPILPIMTYSDEREVYDYVTGRDAPLAFYVFSSNKKRTKRLIRSIGFGGGCVNDTVIHLATPHLPFGGFGASGLGSYHGKAGFDTFTHYKSIVDKWTAVDMPMRYAVNKKFNAALIKKFMK